MDKARFVISLVMLCLARWAIAGEMPPVVVSTPESTLGSQVLVTANHGIIFPREKVDRRWEEGYFITSACYSSAGWAIVMSQAEEWSNQTYKVSTDWPDSWVQSRRADGYFVTSVASDGKNWLTALTRGTGITDQWAGTMPWEMLLDVMVDMSTDGWMVTSLAYNDGLWTVVMSQGTTYKQQKCEYASTSLDITERVNKARLDGYILTTVAADNSRYILIFSKLIDGSLPAQNVTQAIESPRQLFKIEQQSGMSVMFIGG